MLKPPLKHIRSGLPQEINGLTTDLLVHMNGILSNTHDISISGTNDATGMVQANNEVNPRPLQNNWVAGDFTLDTPIEKAHYSKEGPWGQFKGPVIQPSIHFGVQAIPSLNTNAISNPEITTFTNCEATWEVVMEMDVVEYQPTKLPYATAPNVPAGDVIYRTSTVVQDLETCTYAGLPTVNPIRNFV